MHLWCNHVVLRSFITEQAWGARRRCLLHSKSHKIGHCEFVTDIVTSCYIYMYVLKYPSIKKPHATFKPLSTFIATGWAGRNMIEQILYGGRSHRVQILEPVMLIVLNQSTHKVHPINPDSLVSACNNSDVSGILLPDQQAVGDGGSELVLLPTTMTISLLSPTAINISSKSHVIKGGSRV